MLRRQALRKWRKPLIVFTPKSMLRHPDACSPIDDFTRNEFLNVVPDTKVTNAERILLCTGKIGHELHMERAKRKDDTTAIVFVDQLYPFPEKELQAELERHPNARDIVWVQEEPANMGALFYMLPRLRRIAGDKPVLSVKRSASPAPSTGSAKAHELEQKIGLRWRSRRTRGDLQLRARAEVDRDRGFSFHGIAVNYVGLEFPPSHGISRSLL
jgi:2-oxoglutarate dehydrogenase E1 component